MTIKSAPARLYWEDNDDFPPYMQIGSMHFVSGESAKVPPSGYELRNGVLVPADFRPPPKKIGFV